MVTDILMLKINQQEKATKIRIVSLLLFGFITLLSFAEGVAERPAPQQRRKNRLTSIHPA